MNPFVYAGAVMGLVAALVSSLSPFKTPSGTTAWENRSGALTPVALATDYSARIKTHSSWSGFPVRVYFTRDRFYTPQHELQARTGFSRWAEATNGFIAFSVVDSPQSAQMKVRFNPATSNGYTTTRFRDGHISEANISIGIQRGNPNDVACIAAHEFGHALGINGHSENPRDLMYPVHTMGTAWSITRRDLNTLAAIYTAKPQVAAAWTPRAG